MPEFIFKMFKELLDRRSVASLIYSNADLVEYLQEAITDRKEGTEPKELKKISLQMGIKLTETNGVSNYPQFFLLINSNLKYCSFLFTVQGNRWIPIQYTDVS